MAEIIHQNDQEMEKVAGGVGRDGWATVSGLQTGYLALRTKPGYDYANEILGSESYNGDALQITGSYVTGFDGKNTAFASDNTHTSAEEPPYCKQKHSPRRECFCLSVLRLRAPVRYNTIRKIGRREAPRP